ncbi:MAG: EF-P lysine aminoacylase EpmA [Rhodospirillales bacterium]
MDAAARPRWWSPDRFMARRANLVARAAMTGAIRAFFDDRGFLAVETPALQVSPGLEPHLEAFAADLKEPFFDGPAARLYLHTSPEFAMKKLLVAGVAREYQLARVFRNGERSGTHHPEFTMLEWYRAHAGWRDIAADCQALLVAALAAAGADRFRRGAATCDPLARWEWLSVADAFARHAGIDLHATAPDPEAPDTALLAAAAARSGVWVGRNDAWEDIFFRVFLERIEPKLGLDAPTILHDYPVSMAALARRSAADPRVAERFELFVCGLELANGFGELTDAAEQRRRFEADCAKKEALYGHRYPIDEDFLAALSHGMPESAGIAMGFDRLVMLATGAPTIEDVLWTPVATAAEAARSNA